MFDLFLKTLNCYAINAIVGQRTPDVNDQIQQVFGFVCRESLFTNYLEIVSSSCYI